MLLPKVVFLLQTDTDGQNVTFGVSLPIKPHLKQYLRYQLHDIEPLNLDRDSIFQMLIWSQLEKPEFDQSAVLHELIYTETLNCVLNKRMSASRRFGVTVQGCHAINAAFEELFNQYFYTWVDCQHEAGREKQASIYAFMDMVGLGEEQMPFATLKKRHDRYRRALAEGRDRKKSYGNVPPLGPSERGVIRGKGASL